MKIHIQNDPLVSRATVLMTLIASASLLHAADNSITSSLNDMLIETRATKGPILTHHEVLSISGTLPMLGVGSFYHYPSKQNPIDALGISLGQSFNLIGESVAQPTNGELVAVRNSLLESQQLMVEATSLALRRALLQSQLADPGQTNNRTALQGNLNQLEGELKATKTNLSHALGQFRTNAGKPGIVVANWAQESKKSGGFSAAPIFSAGGSKSGRRQGIVILGGIRVSQLFIGNDFKSLFLNLTTADSKFFGELGITTYLLQARDVLSVNELDLEGAFSASAKLKPSYFAGSAGAAAALKDIEAIQIEFQSAFASQLNNLSSIGAMKWKKEEVNFRLIDSRLNLTNLEPNLKDDGWRTVHAVVTLGKRVFAEWSSILKKSPPVILPELTSYETASTLTAGANNALSSVATNIAILNAHLGTDNAYLLNDNLYKGLQELAKTVDHLNKHLKTAPQNWGVVQTIATREDACLRTIVTQLGTNRWSDIERLGAKELEILKAINVVKPVGTQFPIAKGN